METLIVGLIMAVLEAVPGVIKAVNESKALSAEEKKKLLMDIDTRLTNAKVKVASVRFKELPSAPAK